MNNRIKILFSLAMAGSFLVTSCSETKTSTKEEDEIEIMDSTSRVVKDTIEKLEVQTRKVEESLEELEKEFEPNN